MRFVVASILLWISLSHAAGAATSARSVSVSLPAGLTSASETGRMFVLVTDHTDQEPRLVTAATYVYYFNDFAQPMRQIYT